MPMVELKFRRMLDRGGSATDPTYKALLHAVDYGAIEIAFSTPSTSQTFYTVVSPSQFADVMREMAKADADATTAAIAEVLSEMTVSYQERPDAERSKPAA